jgi:hypothetical protein
MFQIAVVATAACTLLFWLYRASALAPGRKRPSPGVVIVLLAMLGLLFLHERLAQTRRTYALTDQPSVVIGVAVDLSLSMLAAPDPRAHPEVESRLQRVQETLRRLFDRLEASRANILGGVTAFTATSEILFAWDTNIPQLRELISDVLAPDIMTIPGTDLGAAVEGLLPLFDLLPPAYQENTRKVAIVVSDGEMTIDRVDLRRAVERLRARGVQIVSLQVGLFGVPEGIAMYSDSGEFLGFQNVAGQTYTVPNAGSMQTIAGEEDPGLYVRAEDPDAASKIHDFVGVPRTSESGAERLQLLITWALLGIALLTMARLLSLPGASRI